MTKTGSCWFIWYTYMTTHGRSDIVDTVLVVEITICFFLLHKLQSKSISIVVNPIDLYLFVAVVLYGVFHNDCPKCWALYALHMLDYKLWSEWGIFMVRPRTILNSKSKNVLFGPIKGFFWAPKRFCLGQILLWLQKERFIFLYSKDLKVFILFHL